MAKEDKDLIDHLAEKLKSHELPYKEGAWEQFVDYEQRKTARPAKRILAPWLTAAAAVTILALGGVYFFQQKSNPDTITNKVTRTALTPADPGSHKVQKQLSENSHNNQKTGAQPPVAAAVQPAGQKGLHENENTLAAAGNADQPIKSSDLNIINNNNNITYRAKPGSQRIIALTNDKSQPQNLLSAFDRFVPHAHLQVIDNYQNQPANYVAVNQDQGQNKGKVQDQSALDPGQSLAQSKKIAQNNQLQPSSEQADYRDPFNGNGYFDPNGPDANNKWALGVMVIPAISADSKLNMGYGVSVGYRLNNRLSVNSGLSYNELSGSHNENGQAAIAGNSGRLLTSVDADVKGLNVPLELRYHVSKKIYVGAGVSALAVLSNKLERHYAVSQMQTSAFEAKNGHQLKPDEMKSIAASLTTKEAIPEAQIDSKNFAGFMNFTFGFQQKINKTKSISIEPYISVPMSNNLSNQNIRLTDGGVRIKLGL